MAGEEIGIIQGFKNFCKYGIRGITRTDGTKKSATPQNKAIDDIKKEEQRKLQEQSLFDKQKRVNSTWNHIKSIFGCGEELTKAEHTKLIQLESAQKRFTDDKDDKTNGSIFNE